jgi:hypothetical protein
MGRGEKLKRRARNEVPCLHARARTHLAEERLWIQIQTPVGEGRAREAAVALQDRLEVGVVTHLRQREVRLKVVVVRKRLHVVFCCYPYGMYARVCL